MMKEVNSHFVSSLCNLNVHLTSSDFSLDYLLKESERIFADTYEDFTSIKKIKTHFEDWKFSYPKSYQQTYCSLSIPMAFAPFVRLELLFWNPLSHVFTKIDEMKWFSSLFSFGLSNESLMEMNEIEKDKERDEDEELIPKLIKKVAGPKVIRLLEQVWFPGSREETEKVASLLKMMEEFLEERNLKEMDSYFIAISKNIEQTITNLDTQNIQFQIPNQITVTFILFLSFLLKIHSSFVILTRFLINSCLQIFHILFLPLFHLSPLELRIYSKGF